MERKSIGISGYELKEWIPTLGSMPVERLKHEDYSRSYEMEVGHLFKLENGQFAVVIESGCSCYSPEKASIELFPSYEKAEVSFDNWDRENKKD